jgi:hypothetical protein
MKRVRLIAVLLASTALTGCERSTGPRLIVYQLTAIDGKPLPVTLLGVDERTTVLSGKLFLDGANHVLRVNDYLAYSFNNGQANKYTNRWGNEYRIQNDTISVGSFSPCPSDCTVNEVGPFSDSEFNLTLDLAPHDFPVYTYRRSDRLF